MTVVAGSEYEAVDGVGEAVARCVGDTPSPVTFLYLDHHVIRCETTDPEWNQPRLD